MSQSRESDLLLIPEASKWASDYLGREVAVSNISYLIQYALIKKVLFNGCTKVSKCELKNYYDAVRCSKKTDWGNLGVNRILSFEHLRESDTTKHVHRLHPYKGKFIPQLAEYFLDSHTDEFKKEVYFKEGNIIFDPFCGSGTTLVQANELGMHAIGIDISVFNTLISNCKISKYNLAELTAEIEKITSDLNSFVMNSNIRAFENALVEELNMFNNKFFPNYEYKISLKNKSIDESSYSNVKANEFLSVYGKLVNDYGIRLKNNDQSSFIAKWFLPNIIDELHNVSENINKLENSDIRDILRLILSRTMRSCRATTHSDLATLVDPINTTYYCTKHYKICKPLFSIYKWWCTYSKDTLCRIKAFGSVRTDTHQICLTGDSRNLNILDEVEKINPDVFELLKNRKISGIFSSPPYVGLIDYHEQHAYAYDLFGYTRNDVNEIGALCKGQGIEARRAYINGIAEVLLNCKNYMAKDYNVFLVANDKYNLYPKIAKKANMNIINQYKRPVLNRTEKNRDAYSETIFYLKDNMTC